MSKAIKKRPPLHKQQKERQLHHRAFLLWAMQSRTKRNQRAVARAVGVSHTSINQYIKKYNWEERSASPTTEVEAQQLYRHLYMSKFGMSEISCVEQNVIAPVSSGTTPRTVGESVQQAISAKDKKISSIHEKEVKRRQLMLLDAAIAYIAQGIKDQSLKRQIRDIPVLIQLRNQLFSSEGSKSAGGVVHESIRVKEAKEKGENVVKAMFTDAKELVSVLGSLSVIGEAEKQLKKENI